MGRSLLRLLGQTRSPCNPPALPHGVTGDEQRTIFLGLSAHTGGVCVCAWVSICVCLGLGVPGWRGVWACAVLSRGCLPLTRCPPQVKVWNTLSGFCFITFTEHSSGVTGVTFTATGYVIVTSSMDGTVRAFDLHR